MKFSKLFILSFFAFVIILVVVDFAVLFLDPSYKVVYVSKPIEKSKPIENTQALENKRTKISFFGDMMFDRFIANEIDRVGLKYLLSNFDDLHRGSDYVVINGECPFTDYQSITKNQKNKALVFTCDPKLLSQLKTFGVTHIGQANNHTRDFGFRGEKQSLDYINMAGLIPVGSFDSTALASCFGDDCKIKIIGFNRFSSLTIEQSLNQTISLIKKAKADQSFVIIYPHWGNEYELIHSRDQKYLASSFAKAGADLIVGAHPHVIQDSESLEGVPVWYSLGNTLFDQWFSEDVKKGMMLSVVLIEDAQKNYRIENIEEKFFSIERGVISPL